MSCGNTTESDNNYGQRSTDSRLYGLNIINTRSSMNVFVFSVLIFTICTFQQSILFWLQDHKQHSLSSQQSMAQILPHTLELAV